MRIRNIARVSDKIPFQWDRWRSGTWVCTYVKSIINTIVILRTRIYAENGEQNTLDEKPLGSVGRIGLFFYDDGLSERSND